MGSLIELDGVQFGELVATNETQREQGRTLRKCLCNCGQETWVLTHSLVSGHTKSCGCKRKLEPGRAARNRLLLDYQMSARRRGLSWDLDDAQFDELVTGNCHFCGRAPSRFRRQRKCHGVFYYNGIDRLNNDDGYEIGNVVTCCKLCNYAKNDMSLSDFLDWVRDLKENCKHE